LLFAFLKFTRNRIGTAVVETKELKKMALSLTLNKNGFFVPLFFSSFIRFLGADDQFTFIHGSKYVKMPNYSFTEKANGVCLR
jgi:hypothetical protein